MSPLSKAGPISIYSQLAAQFRAQILTGELPPGICLPTELELAEQYGLSRGTVRQAMGLLVQAGLLERVPGKGTFVRQPAAPAGERVIGLIVPYSRDALTMDILLGVTDVAQSHGYSVFFAHTQEDPVQEAREIQRLRANRSAGLIIFPTSNLTYDEAIWELQRTGFPFVLVDRYFSGLPASYVGVDNAGGTYQATQHLVRLGYESVGFAVTGGIITTSVHERYQGYQRALADAGMVPGATWLHNPGPARATEEEHVRRLRVYLAHRERPRALVAVNDYTALLVLQATAAEGLRVPEDLALVGFDDIPVAATLPVPLTTVAQPRYEVGVRAAHMLLDRLVGRSTEVARLILPTSLIIRCSCGARPCTSGRTAIHPGAVSADAADASHALQDD